MLSFEILDLLGSDTPTIKSLAPRSNFQVQEAIILPVITIMVMGVPVAIFALPVYRHRPCTDYLNDRLTWPTGGSPRHSHLSSSISTCHQFGWASSLSSFWSDESICVDMPGVNSVADESFFAVEHPLTVPPTDSADSVKGSVGVPAWLPEPSALV